jgi:hypothetical protein
MIGTLPSAEADELGEDGGVLLVRVLTDGPAAGILHDGDIVISIDGNTVTKAKELAEHVHSAEPGDVLALAVIRDGEMIDAEVTLGVRKTSGVRHYRGFQGLHNGLLGQLRSVGDSFVSAEIVLETDTGFETLRAVVGTVTRVDEAAGVFTLSPKDGSDPITYTVSDDTVVDLRHDGDLSGLNTEDETMVVDLDGEVTLVNQGGALLGSAIGSLPGIRRGILGRQFLRPMPRSGVNGLAGRFRSHLRPFPGIEDLDLRLQSILPPEVLERLEGLRNGGGNADIEIDLQGLGLPDALRDLVCNENISKELPDGIVVRCSNVSLDGAQ